MNAAIEAAFWLLVLVVGYVYVGYPALLLVLSKVRPAPAVITTPVTPSVSLIIAAYNEEKVIADKLDNSLGLEYPEHKLEIIVASDGSTDGTNDVVECYKPQGVHLVALPVRAGKSAAQNAAVARASGEVLCFTDADVQLRADAIRKLVRNFADERVGCVVGRVTYVNDATTAVSEGESTYWHYELFLRALEHRTGNLAIGSGAVMAVRRRLFEELDPNLSDDLVLPVLTVLDGRRVVYEREAISSVPLFQSDWRSMLRTKIRIVSKDLRGLLRYRAVLNPVRRPLYAWGLISHKLLRWVVPYFLVALLAANALLAGLPHARPYQVTLFLQVLFYGLAAAGYVWQARGSVPRVVGVPCSFCVVNVAAAAGVARCILGKTSGRWTPVR